MLKATAQLKPRCRAPCASVFVGPRRPFLPWPLVASMESNQRAARPCRAKTIIQQVHFLQCPCGSRIGRSLLSGNESKTQRGSSKNIAILSIHSSLVFFTGSHILSLEQQPRSLGRSCSGARCGSPSSACGWRRALSASRAVKACRPLGGNDR